MTALLTVALSVAFWFLAGSAGPSRRRFQAVLDGRSLSAPGQTPRAPGTEPGRARNTLQLFRRPRETGAGGASMTVLVQELAALLKGGRSIGRVWEELWLLHAGAWAGTDFWPDQSPALAGRTPARGPGRRDHPRSGAGLAAPTMSAGSLEMLAAARAAAGQGAPIALAIRRRMARDDGTAAVRRPSTGESGERRIWLELAACFELAEASGCPLADVLTRYAAHLEAAEDAAGARRTALAGPRATAAILTWLPIAGLALAMLLGVDAAGVLLGTPLGVVCLAAGLTLATAGRLWSNRLVRSAEGHPW